MSAGRDWRDFNESWMLDDPLIPFRRALFRTIALLSWPIRHPHRTVKELEPWGILAAVVGLILAVATFWVDYTERVEERTVRAWQLLTTKAPGNSGKIAALEYLNSEDGFCLLGTCKERTTLFGIDLSVDGDEPGAFLFGANLREADLFQANLRGAYLIRANLSSANLRKANLSNALLDDAILSNTQLMWADLRGADLHGANLRGANFTGADLGGAKLERAILLGANLSHADLNHADLREATFVGANLSGANLSGADLEATNFGGAYLAWADFGRADLRQARFSGADLREAIAINQADLDATCGDEETLLRDGLTIPSCFEVEWFDARDDRLR